MFIEIAKDYFRENTDLRVVGGVISPVADAYGKVGLIDGAHREEMAWWACSESNGFLQVFHWEIEQPQWTKTLQVLQTIRSFVKSCRGLENCRIMLIAGSDLVQTFYHPNIWDPEDVRILMETFIHYFS